MWYSGCQSYFASAGANMTWMEPFCRARSLLIGAMMMTLLYGAGCSRQIEIPTGETAQGDQMPLREVEAGSPSEASSSGPQLDTPREPGLPFHDSQTLPTGTLLTVRLDAPIVAGKSSSFEGILAEPVVVRGKTIIPRGTLVNGRIESVSSSDLKPNRGYVRLALTSVRVSGTDLSVRTASLFARQHNPDSPSNPGIRLEKGHRLTFRLTEPVNTVTQSALVIR